MEAQAPHATTPIPGSGPDKRFSLAHFAILVVTGLLVVVPLFCLDPPLAPASLDWTPLIPKSEVTTGRIAGPPVAPPAERPDRNATQDPVAPEVDRLIVAASDRNGLDANLVRAIITVESGFDNRAVGPKGARGLMQLMPKTAKSMGVKNAFDPAGNIDAGVRHLRELLDRYQGNLRLTLAAYNAGTGRVAQYRGVPPFRTTKTFIQRVLQHQRRYQALHATAPGERKG